jgi:hypothetical protein
MWLNGHLPALLSSVFASIFASDRVERPLHPKSACGVKLIVAMRGIGGGYPGVHANPATVSTGRGIRS